MNTKDVVLFVNSISGPTYAALDAYAARTGHRLLPVVIISKEIEASMLSVNKQDDLRDKAEVITVDYASPASVREALRPYEHRIFAFTNQFENSFPEYKKLIPYLPYLPAPTETSLDWATDKKLMRQAFNAYDSALSPKSIQVLDATDDSVKNVESQMAYPVIIKPSGLERSLLVSVANNTDELSAALTNIFDHIEKAHQSLLKRVKPTVLVEELMQGDMYSVDTYVSYDGTFRHAPMVKVVTGYKVGFDDFFAYLQMTPSDLSEDQVELAHQTAERACTALGLRAVTAHVEMMKTANGWKMIEIGPRIGGYRHELYGMTQGIDHIVNDILNRAGQAPEILSEIKQHAAIFKTYGRQEGVLRGINGLDGVQTLSSYVSMKSRVRPGDQLKFARNNGEAVIEVLLCNTDAAQLQADITALGEMITVDVDG